VVYPTLTFLEEAGYAVSEMAGTKKVFSITDLGRTYLDENRVTVDRVLDHLERFGAKMAKAKEWFGWGDDAEEGRGRRGRNPQFHMVRKRLKAALADIAEGSAEKQAGALSVLETAAEALEALARR
jgi:DNA-binding PadR family transcriptional regulator